MATLKNLNKDQLGKVDEMLKAIQSAGFSKVADTTEHSLAQLGYPLQTIQVIQAAYLAGLSDGYVEFCDVLLDIKDEEINVDANNKSVLDILRGYQSYTIPTFEG